MLVVRPAGPADLDHLLELAILSGPGFTSLPEDPDQLSERLDLSRDSFRGLMEPHERWYTLMLEESETGDVDGIGSVKASVGLKRPFFSFRVVSNAQSSPSLGIKLEQKTLVLVNECTGWTEVGSLFLKADRRKGGAGRLLSQSRYMLIGAEPELFNENVLAELRGVFTPDGACPFWDHVAHKFFPMEFDEADRLTGATDKQFILDLAPRHPIYVELLPEPARAVIGQGPPAGRARHGPAGERGLPPQRPDRHLRRRADRLLPAGQYPHRPRRPRPDRRHRRRGRGRAARPDFDQQRRRLPRRPPARPPRRRHRHLTRETADALKVKAGDTVRVKT